MDDANAKLPTVTYQEIGGLFAKFSDGKVVHWNDNIPGMWVEPYTLATVGSYISSFCEARPGVYRLMGREAVALAVGLPPAKPLKCRTTSTAARASAIDVKRITSAKPSTKEEP